MDPAFVNAVALRTDHVVLGLRMYPLTIGHVFLLCELDVPFMVDECEPTFEDLLTFAFVAAQPTAAEARRALSSWWSRPVWWIWGRICRGKNMDAERDKLLDYVKSQSLSPKVKPPPSDRAVKNLNAPEHWRLLAMLMADFHLSISEAMGTSMNFARALWAAEGERRDKHELAWGPRTSAILAIRKGRA